MSEDDVNLRKGDELFEVVWLRRSLFGPEAARAENAPPIVRRGVVVGGGEQQVRIRWDIKADEWDSNPKRYDRRTIQLTARPTPGRAIAVAFDRLQEEIRHAEERINGLKARRESLAEL